jgi:diguanylate cyclase (GGDEF)-like protein
MTEEIHSEALANLTDVADRAAAIAAVLPNSHQRLAGSCQRLRDLIAQHLRGGEKTRAVRMENSVLTQTANPSFDALRDIFKAFLEELTAAERDQELAATEIAELLALAVLTERSSFGTPGARRLRNSTSPADIAKIMHHARAADRHPKQQYGLLLQAWVTALTKASFIPGGPAQVRPVLAKSLQRLATAMLAEPFSAKPGYLIGFELVEARITTPRALGSTFTLLSQQLIPALGISHQQAPARLAALLGALATGFAEAMRGAALAAAEEINRTERIAWRQRQAKLHHQLQHALLSEQLTGLPNKNRLTIWLDGILTDAPGCSRLGVCLINLDRFKVVNFSLGHDKGDQLLRAVAQRLRRLADHHPGNFLAHLGADEFVIVVENTSDSDDVAKVADLALRTLREPFNLDGHPITITASAGIVERAAAHPTELLRDADIALGWAKTHERGHWAIFDQDRYADQLRQRAAGVGGHQTELVTSGCRHDCTQRDLCQHLRQSGPSGSKRPRSIDPR